MGNCRRLGKPIPIGAPMPMVRNFTEKSVPEVFARRLSECDVTIKNVSSVEADMLDSDDFYNYHGGLISAVKKHRGKMPKSYSTNGGDPQNIVTHDIHEETSRIMRARINNPEWIAGLKNTVSGRPGNFSHDGYCLWMGCHQRGGG